MRVTYSYNFDDLDLKAIADNLGNDEKKVSRHDVTRWMHSIISAALEDLHEDYRSHLQKRVNDLIS